MTLCMMTMKLMSGDGSVPEEESDVACLSGVGLGCVDPPSSEPRTDRIDRWTIEQPGMNIQHSVSAACPMIRLPEVYMD